LAQGLKPAGPTDTEAENTDGLTVHSNFQGGGGHGDPVRGWP